MKTNKITIKIGVGLGVLVGALALTAGPITAAAGVPQARLNGEAAAAMPSRSQVETEILAADRPLPFARSHAARGALGMPFGERTEGKHVRDAARGLEYDQITDVDNVGQPVSMTEMDDSGKVLLAVRFDRPNQPARNLDRAGALKKASDGLAAAGVATESPAVIDQTPLLGGWDVRWSRTRDGVPVRGDEVRVHVREDGHIGSVGQVLHDLAAAPSTQLSKADAQAAAGRQLGAWSSRSGARFSIRDLELQWAGPNGTFDPAMVGAADQPLRLSWVVNVVPQGDAASVARLVVLYVDAGDGSVIGGDVVE